MIAQLPRRRAFAALLVLPLALAASALAQTAPASPAPPPVKAVISARTLEGTERTAALAAASAALNRIASTQGRFSQIAPDGARSGGAIYLQKPGKLRFQYDAPSPLTVVSDGTTVAVEDTQLKDVTRVPLRSTPLFYVLKRDVNLDRDARITRVTRTGDNLLISARDRTGEAEGEITLVFSAADYQLKEWSVTDGQRMTTRIILSSLRAASRLDPRLFRLPSDSRSSRKMR